MEQLLTLQNLIVVSLIGGLMASAKSIITTIIGFIKQHIMTSVDIPSSTNLYVAILRHLEADPKLKKRIHNKTIVASNNDEKGFTESIGIGRFFFMYNKIPLWIRHHRNEQTKNEGFTAIFQTIEIRSFVFAKDLIKSFVDNAYQEFVKEEEGVEIRVSKYDYFESMREKRWPRSFDNVLLPKTEEEKLRFKLSNFLSSREQYKKFGITYKYCILLYGLPGTGKSSLVRAIADYTGYAINYLRIKKDDNLLSIMSSTRRKSIILIEDIDEQLKYEGTENGNKEETARGIISQVVTEAKDKDGNVTITEEMFNDAKSRFDNQIKVSHKINIATLLNVFDGLLSPEEVIFIITTNKKDEIDERLFRPGRIDHMIEFTHATEEQAERMYDLFKPHKIDRNLFIKSAPTKTMALLQQECMESLAQ